MTQENIVTVQIYKQTYHLSSEDQDPGYIKRAADYLDDKMHQAAAAVGNRSPMDIAILAALDIAQEVLVAGQQKESLLDEADRRINTFTRRLENEEEPPSSRF